MKLPSIRPLKAALCLLAAALATGKKVHAQTPYPMSGGNYAENFADIANTTNWPNGFNGPSSTEWEAVAAAGTAAIPDPTRTTNGTATFAASSSTGVQRGIENIQLLGTGTTDNSTALAIDLLLDFTGRAAGTLSFDAATMFNSTGNRAGTLRVYGTTDGVNFSELTGTDLPFVATNNVAKSASISGISLPAGFTGSATARLRFYYHNGTGGSSGSRPKISIDNIAVTSTPQALAISANPASISIPPGTSTTLNVTASGVGALSYQWYQGTAPDTSAPVGINSASFTTPELAATTSYWVRVTDDSGSVDSATATVTVVTTPVVTGTTPASGATLVAVDSLVALQFSKPVNLTADAVTIMDGETPVAFAGLPVTAASTVVLTPAAPLAGGKTYTVRVVAGEVTEPLAADHVFSFTTFAAVQITQNPVSQAVAAGQTAVFSVTATGSGPLAYEWLKDDVPLGAPSQPMLTLNNLQAAAAGQYQVRVTGPGEGNSQLSTKATLTVTAPAVVVSGNGTYTQNFDTLGSGYPLGWTAFKVRGTNATAIGAVVAATVGNGGSSSAAVYNAGATSAPDRALGLQASNTFTGAIGVTLTNQTGHPLEGGNVKLGFTVEQWRTSSAAARERLRFEWKLGGAINEVDELGALATAGWNPVSTFDIVEVDGGTTNVAVDGNAAQYRVVLPATAFTTLGQWEPGQLLHLRWVDNDDTGNDALLALDDFSFVTENVPPPPNYVFWDGNGAAAGAGEAPAGTWGTSAFWTADAAGLTAPTTGWTPGADAVFSAGTDATGAYAVTLEGVQDAGTVTVEEGSVHLTGGGLLLSRPPAAIEVQSAALTVSSPVSGSSGLRKRGPGLLALQGANTFTGAVRLGGGRLSLQDDSALGDTENDLVFAGGELATDDAVTLPATRELSGSGRLSPLAGTTLAVEGPVSMPVLELGAAGTLALNNPSLSVGVLGLKAGGLVTGQPLTLQAVTAQLGGASAEVANPLNLGASTRTVSVDAGSQLTLSGNLSLGGGGITALNKLDGGTLALTGSNAGLNKLSIGGQGTNLNFGGRVKFNNAQALGATQVFFSNGILEATAPLTGPSALQVGVSLGGRAASPVVFEGEAMEFAGNSGLFGPASTLGDIVILVNNTTTFFGPFAAATSATIDGVQFGGSGTVVFSGFKETFRVPLHLTDAVTLVLDTAQLGDAASPSPQISAQAGTKLVVGRAGTRRAVRVYHSLNVQAGATMAFDVAGSADYDSVEVVEGSAAAAVTVAGTVQVKFVDGFAPEEGQAFHLLKWPAAAPVDLSSASLDLPPLPSPLVWNTTHFATNGVVVIEGPNAGPFILGQPQGRTVGIGGSVVFNVQVLGSGPFQFTWRKNGQTFGAPSTNSLSFVVADVLASGDYTVTVTDASGETTSQVATLVVNGPPLITSPPASAVVEDGETVVFSFTAGGSGPFTLQWLFNGEPLTGEDGPTLTRVAGVATHGIYRVRVSNAFGQTTSAAASLNRATAGPANSKPEWHELPDLPPGRVGMNYNFELKVKADDPVGGIYRSASSFSASGLPPGLKINAATGEITGTPTTAKTIPYAVKITAANAFGATVLATRIIVSPLPTGALGVFTGPVERSSILADVAPYNNGPLGGRFDMTVAATGAVSGKITLGAKVYAFKAASSLSSTETDRLVINAAIKRPGLSDLVLALKVDTSTGVIVEGTAHDGAAAAAFGGWRNPWSKLNQATPIAGYYTTRVELADAMLASDIAPLGAGYLSFTVSATTGGLTVSGRLSDGSAITMGTFAGPQGQILLYRTLYAASARGSVLGALAISSEADPLTNTVDGNLTWSRPANPAKTNRLYRAGFPSPGVLDAAVTGARYVAPPKRTVANPTAEPRVLGLTDLANRIEVLLTGAGAETALPLQTDTTASVALTNLVTFNPDPLVNTRKMSLSFNAAKGTFTGKFNLVDNNPLLLPGLVPVKRTVTFQGLIVEGMGEGYFILNQLPAVLGETPANTPQQGGRVVIQPAP